MLYFVECCQLSVALMPIFHRRDAEDAEFKIFLLSAERAESKKAHPPEADYTFNSLTILTMPSRIMGTLKFKSNPKLRPDSLRYVKSWAL